MFPVLFFLLQLQLLIWDSIFHFYQLDIKAFLTISKDGVRTLHILQVDKCSTINDK